MKKLFLLAACSLLLVAGSVNAQNDKVMAKPVAAPAATDAQTAVDNKNASEMVFDAEEFNFGTIKQGESVTHEFSFTNNGKEDMIITNAQGSCGCTVPQYPKEPIKKGATGSIKVTFNSAGKMGMQDKTVTITSNAKNSPRILHLKGTVEAPATQPANAAPQK
ncbi:MAG: DUF1573 domain-containing protein [Bacteroidetes bacterium]|nr:DUF1573 domain-containing protein [Bacteroidota bacterium]